MARTLQKILGFTYYLSSKLGFFKVPLFSKLFVHTYFFYKKRLEDDYEQFVATHKHLFAGDVIDVGANIGYTALLFEKYTKKKVHAFEPNPKNFRLLTSVTKKKKIMPLQYAVGEKSGEVELWNNEYHHGDHRILTPSFSNNLKNFSSFTVPLIDLDSYIKKHKLQPSFVKIDVQGYELPVFKGMKKLVDKGVVVGFEYQPEFAQTLGFEATKMLDFFTKRKYSLYLLRKGGRARKISRAQLNKIIAKEGYVDLICSRGPLSPYKG